jgi:hypothetical protein
MLSSCSRTNGSDEIYTSAALPSAALPGLAARAGGTRLWRSEAGSAGLDCKASRFQIKKDRAAAAQKLHEYLGYDG